MKNQIIRYYPRFSLGVRNLDLWHAQFTEESVLLGESNAVADVTGGTGRNASDGKWL